jgi:signal transduction histidine kinase/streptogramin lyase
MKLFLCLTFHLFLLITPLKEIAGQNVKNNFKNYRVRDGLPSLVTYIAIQDSKGFLWVATDNGVSRFDGKNFENFSNKNGLAGNEIIDIFEDSKGRIWFLSFNNSISYYHNGKFYNSSNDVNVKKINQQGPLKLPIDDKFGNLYFQRVERSLKIVKFASNNEISIISVPTSPKTKDNIVNIYRSSDRKSVFCITRKRTLFQIKNKNILEIKKNFIDTDKSFISLSKKNNSLLVASPSGLYQITDSLTKQLIKGFKAPKETEKDGIRIDKYNNIWVSSHIHNTLFYRFGEGGYQKPHSILSFSFANISFDNEDNIWFSTPNKGIYKLPFYFLLNKKTFQINQSLLKANVTSIFLSKKNILWVGYDNGWVSSFFDIEPTHYNLNFRKKSHNRILQFVEDSIGNIWCISDDNCIKFEKKKELLYFKPIKINVEDDRVHLKSCKTIAIDDIGRIIITTRRGVFFAHPNSIIANAIISFSDKYRLYSSYINLASIYFCSKKGIKKITGSDTINLIKKEELSNIRVQNFFKLKENILLLATFNYGVIALENDKISSILNSENGLIGINCKKIISYKDTLYIITNIGITKALYTNLRFKVFDNYKFINYQFPTYANSTCIKNDSIYISSHNGINILPLSAQQKYSPAPKLILQSFKVNKTYYDLNEEIKFPYKLQTIRIGFITPAINQPMAIRYRYKIANRNGDWQEITSNQLEFSNLGYGKYNILLQAKKHNSPWSSSSNITFTIITPFYATWGFNGIVIVCFCLILVIITKVFLNRKYKKKLLISQRNAEIEKERNRIAADLHDDIGGDLTSLVVLSNIINNSVQGTHSKISKRINLSASGLIDKLNEVIWALDSTNNTLHSLAAYLRRMVSEFSEKNELNSEVSVKDNVYDDTKTNSMINRNVILIIKESLNNIVKHSKSRNVYFSLQKLDDYLYIRIKDDGIGFDIAKRKVGNGLTNMQKRATDINGIITISSQLNKGVTIEVKVPL